jgi:hypothetical protein
MRKASTTAYDRAGCSKGNVMRHESAKSPKPPMAFRRAKTEDEGRDRRYQGERPQVQDEGH